MARPRPDDLGRQDGDFESAVSQRVGDESIRRERETTPEREAPSGGLHGIETRVKTPPTTAAVQRSPFTPLARCPSTPTTCPPGASIQLDPRPDGRPHRMRDPSTGAVLPVQRAHAGRAEMPRRAAREPVDRPPSITGVARSRSSPPTRTPRSPVAAGATSCGSGCRRSCPTARRIPGPRPRAPGTWPGGSRAPLSRDGTGRRISSSPGGGRRGVGGRGLP